MLQIGQKNLIRVLTLTELWATWEVSFTLSSSYGFSFSTWFSQNIIHIRHYLHMNIHKNHQQMLENNSISRFRNHTFDLKLHVPNSKHKLQSAYQILSRSLWGICLSLIKFLSFRHETRWNNGNIFLSLPNSMNTFTDFRYYIHAKHSIKKYQIKYYVWVWVL